MNIREQYRIGVSTLFAILAGVLLLWGIREGTPLSVLAIILLVMLFMIGSAVPRLYGAVPHYHRAGLVVLGVAGAIAYVAGVRADITVGLIVLGGISVFGIAYDVYRNR